MADQKSEDRKELESLRLSICHLAHQAGVQSPMIEGGVPEWMERTKTTERGWNRLILVTMEQMENE